MAKKRDDRAAHRRDCPCFVCARVRGGMARGRAMDQVNRWELEQLVRHGWYAHEVRDADNGTGFSIHTHGMDRLGHADFEIALPLPSATAHALLVTVADRVKAGETFHPGQRAAGVIQGFDVLFVAAVESGRDVLRIILPDPQGRLYGSDMAAPYGQQYADITG